MPDTDSRRFGRVYDYGSRGNYWEVPDAQTPTSELLYVPSACADGPSLNAPTLAAPCPDHSVCLQRAGALWWGLEWSRYALHELWRLDAQPPPLLRGYNVQDLFSERLNRLPKALHKRLKYYRSYLAPGLQEVSTQVHTHIVHAGATDAPSVHAFAGTLARLLHWH